MAVISQNQTTPYVITLNYDVDALQAGVYIQDSGDTSAAGAVTFQATADYFTSDGLIQGSSFGIYFQSGGYDTFINYADGKVSGGSAIFINTTGNTIYNYGDITADSPVISDSNGSDNLFDNTGTISGPNISLSDSGDVFTNSGTITKIAIFSGPILTLATNGTIHNSGVIHGDVAFLHGANSFGGLNGVVDGNVTGGDGVDKFDLSHQTVTGTVSGGAGTDTLSFNGASGGFAVDLAQGTAAGAGESFVITAFENVVGSGYADAIIGDPNDNVIAAAGGNDVVHGGDGNDTIDGGAGDDLLYGDGGINTVSYVSAASGVTVNLGTTTAQATGGSGSDTLSGFTNLTGSAYNDKLIGDGNANVIHGGAGDDLIAGANGNNTLYGDAGNDTIAGGANSDIIEGDAGQDIVTGGAGADTFLYKLASDSLSATPDLITDFASGTDKIDISALHLTSKSSFSISSSGGYTYVSVDANGDGTADSLIKLTGASVVRATDVIWSNASFPNNNHAASGAANHVPTIDHHDLVSAIHAAAIDHGVYA